MIVLSVSYSYYFKVLDCKDNHFRSKKQAIKQKKAIQEKNRPVRLKSFFFAE